MSKQHSTGSKPRAANAAPAQSTAKPRTVTATIRVAAKGHRRYLVAIDAGKVVSTKPLDNHCIVDPDDEVNLTTFAQEFIPRHLLPGVQEICSRRLRKPPPPGLDYTLSCFAVALYVDDPATGKLRTAVLTRYYSTLAAAEKALTALKPEFPGALVAEWRFDNATDIEGRRDLLQRLVFEDEGEAAAAWKHQAALEAACEAAPEAEEAT
ncbi:MAG: hypothetical protein U1F68_17320 [Gammaproteobacteria bacterium]